MANPQMDNFQRSAQFWAVLVQAARSQQILFYSTLAKMTGIPQFGQAEILGNIYFYCEQHGLPLLPSIVVQEGSGKPAPENLYEDIPATHARVFAFDWLSHGAPSVHDFQQAREQRDAAKVGRSV